MNSLPITYLTLVLLNHLNEPIGTVLLPMIPLNDDLIVFVSWEIRSLNEHLKDPKQQAMYAVIHGGMNWALREHSVKFLSSFPFDGFAIGNTLSP